VTLKRYYDEVCILKKFIFPNTDYVSQGKDLRYNIINVTKGKHEPLGVIDPPAARPTLLFLKDRRGCKREEDIWTFNFKMEHLTN
jgi:hypothetical protein